MSTVLWANSLADGVVTSDQADKHALYKHVSKLDEVCRKLGLTAFSGLLDSTDLKFNLEDTELPAGVESTTEVMAQQGVWVAAAQALKLLQGVLAHVQQHKTRFGLLRNDHDAVIAELEESIAFAQGAAAANAKFNFGIVM